MVIYYYLPPQANCKNISLSCLLVINFNLHILDIDIVEEITAAAAVATVAATATAAAAGGPGSGLSSMAGMGNIPTGLPQPGTGIRKSVRNREH